MKKFLAIAAMASIMVACNNGSDTEKTERDSIQSVDSTAEAKKDSIENRADSLQNRIDSTAEAKKDSIKK